MNKKNDYYTVAEASEVLGKAIPTLYKYLHSDKLNAVKNPVTGKYMILKTEVEELAVSLSEWA